MSSLHPVFPRHCEASKQPCAQPYQCGQLCRVECDKLKPSTQAQRRQEPSASPKIFLLVVVGSVLAAGIGIYRSMT